jgi:hypothetical protein
MELLIEVARVYVPILAKLSLGLIASFKICNQFWPIVFTVFSHDASC